MSEEETQKSEEKKEELFPKIGDEVEEEQSGPMTVESLCMNCEENGETRLLFVNIPHFREIIVTSFRCEECGYRNQEVQFGGRYAQKGVKFTLTLRSKDDLNRQLVKSDHCTVTIPELQFEIPPTTQKGTLTTIEGLLLKSIEDLGRLQPVRKIRQYEVYVKIEEFLKELKNYREGRKLPFTIVMDDPSGNSNIENPKAPSRDPLMRIEYYERTKEHNLRLGLNVSHEDVDETSKVKKEEEPKEKPPNEPKEEEEEEEKGQEFKIGRMKIDSLVLAEEAQSMMEKFEDGGHIKEVLKFADHCYNCGKDGEVRMIVMDIPYFKEIIIMAFTCDRCGYRSHEVKPGGGTPEKGKRITLKVTDAEDLSRDLLKAETALVLVPDIDLEIAPGSMGGRFTTVEGLLRSLKEKFEGMAQFVIGDSSENKGDSSNIETSKMKKFLDSLENLMSGKVEFTIIIEDPLGNSYIQNVYAPDPDPNMIVEEFVRSDEMNEELGLLDMKTENYS